MTDQTKSAELSTGVTLPYVERGDPVGVPLVLLHGYTDSWRTWELLLAELPSSLHVYAVTQRGHGDADHPIDGYDAATLTADVAAFLDAVRLEVAVVCGHSGGSYTAQRFAVEHPERTLGLALIGAPRSISDNPVAQELTQAVADLEDPIDPEFVRGFQAGMAHRPLPAGFLDNIVTESLKVPARVWKAALDGLMKAAVPTEVGTITAPTLLLWGDQDPVASRTDQDTLVAVCRDARLTIYEGTGHSVQWEQPARVAADLAAFTASLGGTTSPAPATPATSVR